MSHEVETMAYAGNVPWHGLGTRVPNDLSPEQMLEKAGLNWEVEKKELYFFGDDDETVYHAPGKQALIRTSDNTVLDMVGEEWNPLQNVEAFEFFDDFVKSGDMEMHTAGSLMDGRRVWALAKVNDAFEVFKEDIIEQYLLFSNPHTYGMTIDVRMTPIRVVCNNTLTLSLRNESNRMVKVNHRRAFDAELVKETLGVAKEKLDTYKEAAKFLGSKKYKNETLMEYFDRVFPLVTNKNHKERKFSRNAKLSAEIIHTQPGAVHGAGTWWQAFNTVTYMMDHIVGRSDDTRITSSWFGAGKKTKENALTTALEMAEVA
jgi:phage/plasmid-like protein (TIGR03299 family)